MKVYICQIPREGRPRAWIARDEQDALRQLDCRETCLSAAVSNGMSRGYWATSQAALLDIVCGDMRPDREAMDAVIGMATLYPNERLFLTSVVAHSHIRTVLRQLSPGEVMDRGVLEIFKEPHRLGPELWVLYLPDAKVGGCFVGKDVYRLKVGSMTEAVLLARLLM